MSPGQLTLVGLFVDLGAHFRHRLLDLDAGRRDVGHQGAGERTVGAFLAVERGLPRTGCECDQRALTGFHFGKSRLHRHAAGRRTRPDLGGKRIVAAGIEEHQLDLGVAHGLVERGVDIDRSAELDVHLRPDVGIDWEQVVGAVDGDAVAGIEEHRDIGALRLLAEVEQLLRHRVAGQVGALDHLEPDIAQHRRHRLGVDRRVGKLGDILVGAVADDKGDAAVGLGDAGGEQHAEQGNNDSKVTHAKPQVESNDLKRLTAPQAAGKKPRKCGCGTISGSAHNEKSPGLSRAFLRAKSSGISGGMRRPACRPSRRR